MWSPSSTSFLVQFAPHERFYFCIFRLFGCAQLVQVAAGTGAMAEGQIYFDSTYTLRVVEEDKFKDTERLHEECTGFTESELTCSRCPLRATCWT